jgi:hypothetical protein
MKLAINFRTGDNLIAGNNNTGNYLVPITTIATNLLACTSKWALNSNPTAFQQNISKLPI